MSLGLVLVIDDDEWVGRLLAVALRESGYEVMICASAVEGFEKAVEVQPDCIICDVDLPDVDGFWVARKIRMASSRVSVTPFLFLSGLDDRDTRIQGFHVGADVYMTKPFRIDEVVAQVGALVQMVSRLRQNRTSFLSLPPTDAAMVGDLAQMSIATVLTLLDMERRSGKLEISSKQEKAVLLIVSGAITSATQGGDKRDPLELLRTLLTWNSGRFAFRPDESEATPQHDNSINALLMEAVRLEDETRASLLDPGEVASTSLPGDRRPKMPNITMPPASEPSESTRIADALASTFASSVPPANPSAATARPIITPGPSKSNPGFPAIKKPSISSATTPAISGNTPSTSTSSSATPATPPAASGLADRAPPLRPIERKPAATLSSDALKPRTPLPNRVATPGPAPAAKPPAPRITTPGPMPALRPTADPPAPPPPPVSPPPASIAPISEVEVGWSEPPPAPTAEPSAPPAAEEGLDKLRPPPPTGASSPAAPRPPAARGTPVRTVPLPNPRVGQGSGEK